METPDEMLAAIMESASAFEGYSLHRFRIYKEGRDGEPVPLDIEVRVSAPNLPKTRYSVTAIKEDGTRVTGNGKATLAGALYILSMSPQLN
jgi:hypothetical protein